MKKLIYTALYLSLATVLALSCKKQDDYLKYVPESKPTVGRPEMASFLGGNESVRLSATLSSDPKVKKIGVFWFDNPEGYIFDVDLSENREVTQIIPIEEGSYDFEVCTFDAAGNRSIEVQTVGTAYGPNYISGRFNRFMKSYKLNDDGNVEIVWQSSSDDMVETVVGYYKNGQDEVQQVVVDPKAETTTLEDPKADEQLNIEFSVLSYYHPEDAFEQFTPVEPSKYIVSVPPPPPTDDIVNGGQPVEGAEINGNWGVPKGWNITDNVRNQAGNTLGGWKNDPDGRFHVESQDWGGPGFENGKIWQTPTLPAGTYSFTTYYLRGNTSDGQTIDLVAAAGDQLPDRDNLGGALASKRLPRDQQDRQHSIVFTLTEPTKVSLGLLITLDGSEQYLQFTWMKLEKLLVNPGEPVEGAEINGNWGVPKGWNVTDNVRNQAGNSVGGWKNESNGLFHFESQDWNGPGFENGKVWQSPTLPAGTYTFTVNYGNSDGDPGKVMYVAAAKGAELPDTGDMGTALASKEIVGGQMGDQTITFALTEPTQVSLGLVITLDGSNHWLQFKYMKLTRMP